MIETLVFDLDGPILDVRRRHYECYCRILRRYGDSPLTLAQYWALRRARAPLVTPEQFRRDWLRDIENDTLLALDTLQPGAVKLLTAARAAGARLVLATLRQRRDGVMKQLIAHGVAGAFNEVVCTSGDSGAGRKARAVRAALPGLRPEATWWIGDTEVDVEAARYLGCGVTLVSNGVRDTSQLALLRPDGLVAGVHELRLQELQCAS